MEKGSKRRRPGIELNRELNLNRTKNHQEESFLENSRDICSSTCSRGVCPLLICDAHYFSANDALYFHNPFSCLENIFSTLVNWDWI